MSPDERDRDRYARWALWTTQGDRHALREHVAAVRQYSDEAADDFRLRCWHILQTEGVPKARPYPPDTRQCTDADASS